MIGLVKRAEISFFQNVLFGRLDIDPFGVVDRSVSVANADDFQSAFVSKRQRRNRADVPEALHDSRAFFGIDFQHVHGPLD